MNHEVEKFYRIEVEPRIDQIKKELEKELEERSTVWKKQFLLEFKEICKEAKEYYMNQENEQCFLLFHLLRTRILDHNYQYQVRIYNQEWYLEDGRYVGDFNVEFVYDQYEKLWNELMNERLKYVKKISESDVRFIMMETIREFHQFIVCFLRENINEAIHMEEYKSLTFGDRLEIKVGEYLEIGDFVFIDQKNKDYEKLMVWLDEEKEGDEYTFEDFREIELRDKNYSNLDLRYADFSKAKFSNVIFSNCRLEGTRFDGCNMEQVRFD
jgi:BTB/POZ domain-containing protein KCTD9